MKRLVAIIILLLAATCSAIEVKYAATRPSDYRQLERLANRLPLDSACISIQKWLSDDGYMAAQVDSSDGQLVVSTGPRYYLEQIIVQDSTVDTVQVIREPFTNRSTDQNINRLLAGLEAGGFYFASAVVQDYSIHDTLVSLWIRITRGPRVVTNSYVFSGLDNTPPSMLERYLPPTENRSITPNFVREVESAAERIPFVVFVPSVDVRPREGYTSADLHLSFIERRQFRIEGVAGYVPSTSSGLLWTLDARFQNLFGGGREAFIKSERRERGRNLLDVGYSQPVFFAGLGTIGGRVSTRDYRDEFYEFAVQGNYDIQFNPVLRIGVTTGWRNVEPNDDLSAYNAFSVGLMFDAANRRDAYRELPYYSLYWSVSYSHRRYKDDTVSVAPQDVAVNETRTSLKLASTLPIWKALAGHLSATYLGYETPEEFPPVSELYLIGGPGTIRGFRNDQFLAQRAAIAVVEPRLQFTNGFMYLFADGAYINVPETEPSGGIRTDESFHAGYGIGFDVRSAKRAVDISLGWNRELSFDQPRLSVQFISDL